MKSVRPLSIAIVLIASLLVAVTMTQAQQNDDPIQVQVDRTSATTDDVITMTVSVSGSGNLPQPQLPALEGFNVVSSGSSSQISVYNNVMSAQTVYTYRLQAYQTGTLTIGAVTVTIDGNTYSTDPIDITITQGTGQPDNNSGRSSVPPPSSFFQSPQSLFGTDDSYVEAEIDNDSPYVGEQVTYTFRLYQSIAAFGQPSYDPPDFTGFWHDQQPQQTQYMAQNGTQTYRVTELQTYLFPTQAGDVTIEPATLVMQGSFFNNDMQLQTDPITLHVNSLPADAPEGFNGAVGQYSIQSGVDNTTVNAGDPVTMRVTISGTGNINTLPDLEWQPPDAWRSFDATSTVNSSVTDGKLGGDKTIDYVLISENGGDFQLPAVSFTFFDPEVEHYQTVTTDPITVAVNGEPVATVVTEPQNVPDENGQTQLVSLQPIREALDGTTSAGEPLTSQPLYWLAWGVPALIVIGSGAFDRRQRYLLENSSSIRRSRAYKRAQKALKRAERQNQPAHEAAGDILAQYLSAKVSAPINGLTQTELATTLTEHGISPDNIHDALEILHAVDTVRYGASSIQEHILSHTATLITTMEKEFAQ